MTTVDVDMTYERAVGHISGRRHQGALTDNETSALREFIFGWLAAKAAYKRDYPDPVPTPPEHSTEADNLESFPVGNQDPEKRGYGHSQHPDREENPPDV